MDITFELAHVGINTENAEEADKVAQAYCDLFGFAKKVGNSSVFAGKGFEVMKSMGKGKCGHVAIKTNDIVAAKAYLESKGYKFDEASAKMKADGSLNAIYLEDEVGGFAIHLLQA